MTMEHSSNPFSTNTDVLERLARWLDEPVEGEAFRRRIEANTLFQQNMRDWLIALFFSAFMVPATSGLPLPPMIAAIVTQIYLIHAGPPNRPVGFESIFVVLFGAIIGTSLKYFGISDSLNLPYIFLLIPVFLVMLAASPLGRSPGKGSVRRFAYRLSVMTWTVWIWAQLLMTMMWARSVRVHNEWRIWKTDPQVGPENWTVEFDCPTCAERTPGADPGHVQTWPTMVQPRQVLCPQCGASLPTMEPIRPEAVRSGLMRRLSKHRARHPRLLFVMLDRRRRAEIEAAFAIGARYIPEQGVFHRAAGELATPDGSAVHAVTMFHDPTKGTVWSGAADAVIAVVPATDPANDGVDPWNDVEIALSSVECPFEPPRPRALARKDHWRWWGRALRHLFTPAKKRAADWWDGPPPILSVWRPACPKAAGPSLHRGHPVVFLNSPADLYAALSISTETSLTEATP